MTDHTAGSLAERLKVLEERFAGQFPDRTGEIQSLWQQIESDDSDRKALETLYRLVHGLAGSGATFGFPLLSEAARQCELVLLAGIDTGNLPLDEARSQVSSVLAALDI